MAAYNRAHFTEVMLLDGASLNDDYTPFDSATPAVGDVFIVQNLTDIGVMLSFDGGETDHLPVASDSYILLDLNIYITDRQIMIAKGTDIQARALNEGETASAGDLWISIITSRKS